MTAFSGKRIIIGFALFLGFAGAAGAAPTPEEITRAVEQLGDNNFGVRQKASAFLKAAGKAAEPALKEALKSDDREVVRRAREILDLFKWGIYPDTPKEIVDLVNRYQGGNFQQKQVVIRDLFRLGARGYEVLVRIAQAESDPNVRRFLLPQMAMEAPWAVAALVPAEDFSTLEELLEMTLASDLEQAVRNYVAYLILRGRLDAKIAVYRGRVEKANDTKAAEVLAALYRAKGDRDRAKAAAEKSGKPQLVEAILYEQGNWKELLDRHRPEVGPSYTSEIEALSYLAAFQRLAGRKEEMDKTLADIRRFGEEKTDNTADLWGSAEALFLNDHPREAIEVLRKGKNLQAVFELLAAQGKYREAFAVADQARKEKSPQLFPIEVRRARALYVLGQKEQALELFARLAEGTTGPGESAPFLNLVETELRLGLKDLAHTHAGALADAGKVNRKDLNELAGKLFPAQASAAQTWLLFFARKFPEEKPSQTLQRLGPLLEAKPAEAELADLSRQAEQLALRLPAGDREKWLLALAETAEAAGHDRLARTYFERAGETGSYNALIRLGDYQSEKRLWKQAAASYGQAWEIDRKEPLSLYLQGWALTQAGREKEGRKLMDLAHWLPLGNEMTRYNLADRLAKRNLADGARREREITVRIGRGDSWHVGEALRFLAYDALAKKDYLTAAGYHERAMLRCLRTDVGFLERTAYLVVPVLVHRQRARGLIAAGQVGAAMEEARLCQSALPADVDVPIHLVADLDRHGHPKEADELFGETFDYHERLCKEFPQSGWAHNSAAWLAACCRRKLDQALAHASRAAELYPDNPAYLDTLAEVHFQRGDRGKAVELMKKCLEMDPKRPYFRKQLKRIEAGDSKAEVPDDGD